MFVSPSCCCQLILAHLSNPAWTLGRTLCSDVQAPKKVSKAWGFEEKYPQTSRVPQDPLLLFPIEVIAETPFLTGKRKILTCYLISWNSLYGRSKPILAILLNWIWGHAVVSVNPSNTWIKLVFPICCLPLSW